MALTLDLCRDEDFREMTDVMFDSMAGNNEFVNAIYPHNMTKEGRDKHCARFLRAKNVDSTQRWLKVTDTATCEIIGVIRWNIYDDPQKKPAETQLDGPEGTWDTLDDKQWAQAMFNDYMLDRWKVIREATGPVLCLSLLAVAPKHQCRGAGTMLTKWGTDYADTINAEVISL
ncbi:MAG: hypothetical protein M1837_005999 [Sclerophora amabilis]|nr:MAG: hypothetical protein M1837_005999 [Sclerophora amabilis]